MAARLDRIGRAGGHLLLTRDSDRPRAVVLISGSGSNLQALIDAGARGDIDLGISLVISNVDGVRGLQRAELAGIDTLVVRNADFVSRAAFDAELMRAIDSCSPDVIILAGFMRILGAEFVARYLGRLLNIHPSLLPAYPGLNTHRRVLEAGDEWHGCTVHFVTAELDAGPPLIQGRLRVSPDDDASRLAERVLELEHRIYPIAADLVAAGRAVYDGERVTLDGAPLDRPLLIEE